MLACHARGRGFEPRPLRHITTMGLNMNLFEEYAKTVIAQINLNKKFRERSLNDESPEYLRDFCVVRSDVGQRTGKTELSLTIARGLAASGSKVLFITTSDLSSNPKEDGIDVFHSLTSTTAYRNVLEQVQSPHDYLYDMVIVEPALWIAEYESDPMLMSLIRSVPIAKANIDLTFLFLG